MPTYRKLKAEEVEEIAQQLRYSALIDVAAIRELVADNFSKDAYKALLSFGSQYNDETDDLRLQSVEVFDKDNNELERQGEGDDDKDEGWHSTIYDMELESDVAEDLCFDYVVYMDKKLQPRAPELYVKQD